MAEIVNVKGIRKAYGDFWAVNGLDFSVCDGEVFGFLGPNGAGKTTTINLLTGLSRPSQGEIYIGGINTKRHPKLAQRLMGIVPDESNLYGELNGFDNLCFCASLYGIKKQEREQRATMLLKQFGLLEASKLPFSAYSKGMRRKLTIASGLIHSPRILFLDEPTTGVDVESARQIRSMILDLKQNGTTVFLTTHYIEEAERICDRVAFIVGGRLVASGSIEKLMQDTAHGHTIQLVADRSIRAFATELEARFNGSRVAVNCDNSLSLISFSRISLLPVMQFFDEKRISIYEARELRPSLEDVFVKITGLEAIKLKCEKGAVSFE